MKSSQTVRYETGKDTGKAALTFAHLSDLHGCFYGENQEGLLEAIYEADPDLVVVSGDMIVGKPGINRKTFAFFKELTAKYPVFFSNGNHETRYEATEDFRPVYKHFIYGLWKNGVEVLKSKAVPFEKNGRKLMVAGYEAEISYFSRFNRKVPSLEELKSHLGEKDPETETVLLAHNPMFFSVYKEWGADLTFSGQSSRRLYPDFRGSAASSAPSSSFFRSMTEAFLRRRGTRSVSAQAWETTRSRRGFSIRRSSHIS